MTRLRVRVPVEYASELRQDLKTGTRVLARSPGFTAVALISLALGIGVAASAYSEMNGLLRDLPGVVNPDELVAVHKPMSFPTYSRFRQLYDLFSDSAAYVGAVPLVVSAGDRTERA